MKRLMSATCAILAGMLVCVSPLEAQVRQSGNVTPTHVACWTAAGVIQDCGASTSPYPTTFGVLNGTGADGICVQSAASTSAGYTRACLGSTTAGGAVLSVSSFGTAPTPGFVFQINGTTTPIAVVSGATVSGDGACFSNTTGTLIDCGFVPFSSTLPSGDIFVGNASNVATAVVPSGVLSMTNAGVFSLTSTAFANPSVSIGLSATNGSATTAMRSDAAPALSQAISPTWTGNHTFSPTSGVAITANGPASSLSRVIDIIQSFGGTDTVTHQLNNLAITDSANLGTGTGNGLNIQHTYSSGFGSRQALQVGMTLSAASNVANTKHFYAAAQFGAAANSGDNGTNTGAGALGSIIGVNPAVTLNSGATNLAEASGIQVTMFTLAGSSVSQRSGIEISDNSGAGGIQGATFDDAIVMGNVAGSAGWKIGIAFDRTNFGSAPISATGTAIKFVGAQTVDTVLDASAATVTTNLIVANNFTLTGAGNITTVGAINMNASGIFSWNNRSALSSPSNGSVLMTNNAGTGFTTLQLGPDVAAPSAVSLAAGSVVAGTSNTAGVNFTIAGSIGTGTGTGGAILLRVAPAGGSGTSQNSLVTRQTILGNGNIGFGTETNPQQPFVLSKNATTGIVSTGGAGVDTLTLVNVDGSSTNIGLQAYGTGIRALFQFATARGTASSFTATQSGDELGVFGSAGASAANTWANGGANTARIVFSAAETFSSTASGTAFLFETTPKTTNARATAMTVQASGGLSIGASTDPGTGGLYVNGATITLNGLATDATHTDRTVCQDTTSKSLFFGSGAAGICLGTSSARFKHDIEPLVAGLEQIVVLRAVSYRLNADYGDPDKLLYGFTAEQGATVLPDLVGFDRGGRPQTFDYMGVVPVLVRAVQQLKADNDNLRGQIHNLKESHR